MVTLEDTEGKTIDIPLLPKDKVDIYVHNMAGQLIRTFREPRFNISNLQNGAYILNAIINDTHRAELKVYKQ